MKKVIIVQARMSSTRLPGKVLKEVCGKPLLEHLISRLKRVEKADQIIIATTINHTDEPIVALCEKLAISYYRGSEEDVLSRFYETATQFCGEIIIRITSDCPVIDPGVVDYILSVYLSNQDRFDFVSNTLVRTYPRGMDTEVFSFRALQEAHRESTLASEREEVTPFFHQRPQRYRLLNVSFDTNQSHHRWTLDTPEDLDLITRIYQMLYPKKEDFSLKDMLEMLAAHPEFASINSQVKHRDTWKIQYTDKS